jgi:hypothetical protein
MRTLLVSGIFYALHFVIFLHVFGNSDTLLKAYDMNCIYNYTLCSSLNAALVMHIMRHGGVKELAKESSIIHKILLLGWIYLSIFSNLFSSIVLAAYVASELSVEFLPQIKDKSFKLLDFVRANYIHLLILVCWLISHVYEFSGDRANNGSGNILLNLLYAIGISLAWIVRTSIFILAFSALTFILWKKRCMQHTKTNLQQYAICLLLMWVYIVLLCAAVNGLYIGRPEIFFPIAFWLLLGIMSCFTELIEDNFLNSRLALIILGTVLVILVTLGHTFNHSNVSNISYKQCEALMNDVIDQFVTAENEGKQEIDLVVPKFEQDDNWPYGVYGKDRFGKALYKHGIIHSEIQVNELILSQEMTDKYIGQ